MIFADILMWFLLILGTYIVFISYWLAAQGLFPAFVARCREQIQAHPVRYSLVGVLVTVPAVLAAIGMLNAANPALKISGMALAILTVLMGLLGSSGLASGCRRPIAPALCRRCEADPCWD